MRFGLKELKILWHTVKEIASANNLESKEAIQKFFKDIDEHYDDKLGFESKINQLQAQVNRLSQEEARLRTQLLILPLVAPSLTRLIQRGVSEQDIVDIAELLKNDGGGSSSSDSSGVTIQEIRSLIAELRSYGSIKSTISQLSQHVDKLRNQLASLHIERQNLHMQNQRMFSTLLYSKQMVSFFSGSSVSLKNEIVGLISIIAYMMYLLDVESKGLQKLQDNIGSHPDSEFIPLTMAARGEVVDLQKLKVALVKAIEVTLEKLNSNSKLNEILSKGRLALLGEQL